MTVTMPDIQYSQLDEALWPLMNKFYRSHQSSMKAVRDAQLWIGRRDEIIAGLCLRPVASGFWLTGLLVTPAWRGRQVARQLIEHATCAKAGTVWLFCHPDLLAFYQPLGFEPAASMPLLLNERLARYQRSKPLIALARCQSSLAGSNPGNSTSV